APPGPARRCRRPAVHLDPYDPAGRAAGAGAAPALRKRRRDVPGRDAGCGRRPADRRRGDAAGGGGILSDRWRVAALPSGDGRARSCGAGRMRVGWKHLAGGLAGLVAAGMLVVWIGVIDITASSGHWKVTNWFLHWAMRSSIRTAALGIEAPP